MDGKQLIKWHAQELINLLTREKFTFTHAKMVVELEKFFFKSDEYKDIDVILPEVCL